MPWPVLLLWGAAAAAGAVGVKKGYDAYCDNETAEEVVKDAKKLHKDATENLDKERVKTQSSLESLGKLKVNVFTNQIKHLVEMHKKFGSKLEDYDQNIYIDDMPSVEAMVNQSLELSNGLAGGAASGALAALGSYGAVQAFAAASTGTAISSLGGVAATNATLAWLGGGSLAAGGFGMAGGMVALGGIVLGPLLAVGGFWAASKAEENKTKAYEYSAEVDKAVEKMKTMIVMLQGIQTASSEMSAIIHEMIGRFELVKVYDDSDKEAFYRMFQVGKGLKKILDIPILNYDGTARENIRMECSGYLALGTCK